MIDKSQGREEGAISVKITGRNEGVVGPEINRGPRFIAPGWEGILGEAESPPQRQKCRGYAP
jgi:hypothetical protein